MTQGTWASLFLVRNLYLSGVWQGLQLWTDTKKGTCCNAIGLCAPLMLAILLSIFDEIGRAYVIAQRKTNFTWTPHNFSTSDLILKLNLTIAIAHEMRKFQTRSNSHSCRCRWNCPKQGHILRCYKKYKSRNQSGGKWPYCGHIHLHKQVYMLDQIASG